MRAAEPPTRTCSESLLTPKRLQAPAASATLRSLHTPLHAEGVRMRAAWKSTQRYRRAATFALRTEAINAPLPAHMRHDAPRADSRHSASGGGGGSQAPPSGLQVRLIFVFRPYLASVKFTPPPSLLHTTGPAGRAHPCPAHNLTRVANKRVIAADRDSQAVLLAQAKAALKSSCAKAHCLPRLQADPSRHSWLL